METASPHPGDWPAIARWRKAERERLLRARLELTPDQRRDAAVRIMEELEEAVGDIAGRIFGITFPIRGEMDLRPFMERLVARGGRVALLVVVEPKQPLAFHAYAPGDRLARGFWNIPVPATARPVRPDVLVAPLVGWDRANYRLGYGGGYFDRTLASLAERKPLVVGIGFASAELATIFPQPHDIPMDQIITA